MTWSPDYDPTEELLHGTGEVVLEVQDASVGPTGSSASRERRLLRLQERCQAWWDEVRDYRLFAASGFLRHLEFHHVVAFCQREMGWM
jgi:hypothetical protein